MRSLPVLALCLAALASSACTTLKISPPSEEKPTLLVLPFKVVNTSQASRLGFHYIYEIASEDASVDPLTVVFKRKYKGDFVIIDSLPPGNYRVRKFSFVPAGVGDHSYGDNVEGRNDPIRLDVGKITVFSKSLNIRIYHAIPGRGRSVTYERSINQVTPAQSVGIIETLRQLPNFDHWKLYGSEQQIEAGLQGDWLLIWEPTKKRVSANGPICYRTESKVTVTGPAMRGSGMHPELGPYEILGFVRKPGTIRGSFTQDGAEIGEFWGRADDGKLKGKYVDDQKCRGNWTFTRNPDAVALESENKTETTQNVILAAESEIAPSGAASAVTGLAGKQGDSSRNGEQYENVSSFDVSGRYLSSITSESLYIFKRRYRNIGITLNQQGDRITGIDDSGELRISGTIKGNTISYQMEPSIISSYYNVVGEWTIGENLKQMTGYWRDSRGDGPGEWNLKRLE